MSRRCPPCPAATLRPVRWMTFPSESRKRSLSIARFRAIPPNRSISSAFSASLSPHEQIACTHWKGDRGCARKGRVCYDSHSLEPPLHAALRWADDVGSRSCWRDDRTRTYEQNPSRLRTEPRRVCCFIVSGLPDSAAVLPVQGPYSLLGPTARRFPPEDFFTIPCQTAIFIARFSTRFAIEIERGPRRRKSAWRSAKICNLISLKG